MRNAFLFIAILALSPNLHALNVASWLGEFNSSVNGKAQRVGSGLKPGYTALGITASSESEGTWLAMQMPDQQVVVLCVKQEQYGKLVAPEAWAQAAESPALNDLVGYFDETGQLKQGRVSAFVLGIASDDSSAYPALVPVVDGLTQAPLILDPQVLKGELGEAKTFTLPESAVLSKLVMTHKVAGFLAAHQSDEDFNCGSGWDATGVDCVHEILGCPVHDLSGIQVLLADFGQPPPSLHWAWYGDSDFGFVTGPSGDSIYSGYMVTFFLTKGEVSWIWSHRAYPEILSIGEQRFLRVAGCKPSSDGCDAFVTEWAVDPYEKHRKPKEKLHNP